MKKHQRIFFFSSIKGKSEIHLKNILIKERKDQKESSLSLKTMVYESNDQLSIDSVREVREEYLQILDALGFDFHSNLSIKI